MFLKDLEAVRPSAIVDIIHSGESFVLEQAAQKSIKALRECVAPQQLTMQKLVCDADTCRRMIYAWVSDVTRKLTDRKRAHCCKGWKLVSIGVPWYVTFEMG